MNKLNESISDFFKDTLKEQQEYKSEISQRVNFCLSITISLAALNFYIFINMAKSVTNILDVIHLIFIVIVFMFIITILYFLAKAYIGIVKKHIYPHFPYANDLINYYKDLKTHNDQEGENKFLEYLIDRYIHYSNEYQLINDKKIKYFLRAYDLLLFTLIPSSVNLVFFGLKHFNIY